MLCQVLICFISQEAMVKIITSPRNFIFTILPQFPSAIRTWPLFWIKYKCLHWTMFGYWLSGFEKQNILKVTIIVCYYLPLKSVMMSKSKMVQSREFQSMPFLNFQIYFWILPFLLCSFSEIEEVLFFSTLAFGAGP